MRLLLFLLCFDLSLVMASTKQDGHLNFHVRLDPIPSPLAEPFSLSRVRLTKGSMFEQKQQINLEYLLMWNMDSLLWNFRTTAGLPAPGQPYGGWEAPTCDCRGKSVAHWLSSAAMMWASTGNSTLFAMMSTFVDELQKCQQAIGSGYVSAFPSSEFDRLENLQNVWAPYYTIHKILQSLLDQWQIASNQKAFDIMIKLADYFVVRIKKVLSEKGMDVWQQMLVDEWGGMNEIMYSLYSLTNNTSYKEIGDLFEHYVWTRPLLNKQDDLPENHANIHIPQIIGSMRGYEVSGNKTQASIAQFFYDTLTSAHSFATGGSNTHEHWHAPHHLGDDLDIWTQESCTTYNIMKVDRHLFQWTADPKFFDHYERAQLNGIIGNQKGPGEFIYMLPLGVPGQTKGDNAPVGSQVAWGEPFGMFYCCYDTLMESFSKLGDSIYFHSGSTLFVNLFVASTLNWSENNVVLVQDTSFPTTSMSKLIVQDTPSSPWTLKIRVPQWTQQGASILINSQAVNISLVPGTFFVITRVWQSNDTVEINFPMSFHAELLDDNRTHFNTFAALQYGPLVLAGLTDSPLLVGDMQDTSLQKWIFRPNPDVLEFKLASQFDLEISAKPLMELVHEHYTVYFNITSTPDVCSLKACPVFMLNDEMFFDLTGSAKIVNDTCLFSGNSHDTNNVWLTTFFQDSALVTAFKMTYSYMTPSTTGAGTNFSVVLENLASQNTFTLYASPQYTDHNSQWSDVMTVAVSGLNISISELSSLRFIFSNNDRYIQLSLTNLTLALLP